MPADACLVLEFRQSGRCGYYFVDHSTRCLFWLEDFDAMVFLDQVRVDFTAPLVGHEMKSLYWCVPLVAYLAICYLTYGFRLHNEYFPELRPFMVDGLKELKDVLIHAIGGLGSTLHVNIYLVLNIMDARFLDVTMDYVTVQLRSPSKNAFLGERYRVYELASKWAPCGLTNCVHQQATLADLDQPPLSVSYASFH